ncbi:MAG: hypothetical protein KGH49_02720 [Candidatus Micrarchaeota archaeon]|nr:hypothetical protein [Candidatus Micrarchaeota archaeon]
MGGLKTKHMMVNNVMVIDSRPYVCVHNIEGALGEVKDYLNADYNRYRTLMLLSNMGFEKGLIVRNSSGVYVQDNLTKLIMECEPTKYKILERIASKYGIRNLSIAFERVLHEKSYFTSPEYLNAIMPNALSPAMNDFIKSRRS